MLVKIWHARILTNAMKRFDGGVQSFNRAVRALNILLNKRTYVISPPQAFFHHQ